MIFVDCHKPKLTNLIHSSLCWALFPLELFFLEALLCIASGGRSLKNTADHLNYFTMGSQLDRLGYYGRAFHNNLYTYYDRHKTHNNLGYSDGYTGYGNGMEQYVEDRWPQSDLGTFLASTGKFTAVEGVTVPEGYVKRMQNTVKNKVRYCKGVLDTDYFRLLMESNDGGV